MRSRHYVIAGTYKQALIWAEERGISPNILYYINRADQLRGLYDIKVVVTGTRSKVMDSLEDLDWMAKAHNIKFIYEPTIP